MTDARWPVDPGAPDRDPPPASGPTIQLTPWGLAAWIDRDPSVIQRLPRDAIAMLARAYLAERAQRRRAE